MRLKIEHLGPLRRVDFAPGDLTVLVGPQASGKSVLLQTLKAVVDVDPIVETLKQHGYHWKNEQQLVELLYGEGMGPLVGPSTRITVNGEPWTFLDKADSSWSKRGRAAARLFYVPAQRVLTLQDGWPRPLTSFEIETPFVVKQFSEDLRRLLEEWGDSQQLFPVERRWKQEIREQVADAVFHGAEVRVDDEKLRKRIVLDVPGGGKLPFMSWSAGQREFIPLMLGLYWLMPTQAKARRQKLEWAVIEEPEMGLHPQAISGFALLVLDLVKRGYRVVLATHSPHLVELMWALTRMQRASTALPELLPRLFGLPSSNGLREIGSSLVDRKLKVYYLGHTPEGVITKDISSLDPADHDPDVAHWGGLTDFAERASELVSEVMLFP